MLFPRCNLSMCSSSALDWISVYPIYPFSQIYGWALDEQKKIGALWIHAKGKLFITFQSEPQMFLYTVFALVFSFTLCRQKCFSKQFQAQHLLVQCLPQPAIHICSPHKLDPIRQCQTIAHSSMSLAQCQGSRTIQKCFLGFFFASITGIRSF